MLFSLDCLGGWAYTIFHWLLNVNEINNLKVHHCTFSKVVDWSNVISCNCLTWLLLNPRTGWNTGSAHHSHVDNLKSYHCPDTLSKVMGSLLSFSLLKRGNALILLSAMIVSTTKIPSRDGLIYDSGIIMFKFTEIRYSLNFPENDRRHHENQTWDMFFIGNCIYIMAQLFKASLA